jgi:hydrogenase/urease accessory protein HupE
VTLPFDVRDVQRPPTEVAAEYTGLGIVHILEGLDHLAFVLCLCMLTRGATLLWPVTAFNVGHSISLASSFLDVVAIPVPPVEATIAVSIAFLAREALVARRGQLRYMTVAAGFGLLHGLVRERSRRSWGGGRRAHRRPDLL